MANTGKPKALKSNEKPSRLAKSAGITEEAEAAGIASAEKKVSQKLLETIERRKKNKTATKGSAMFARPPGRRGRRPKGAVEYTPENQEEEALVMESDYEGIEYDTGIRLKQAKDESGFNVEYEFDEELNFDR